MVKKKIDVFPREKEYKNPPKNEDKKRLEKETPGLSGKLSGR